MYIKSDEELSGVLQTLPEVFKERYQTEIDWCAVLAHLKNELAKHQSQTIERQFNGWSVGSILAMINTLEKLKPSKAVHNEKNDTATAPFPTAKKKNKKNG